MKNFLITGFYFEGYHGSMMHICEIAKYLKAQKYNVSIVAVEISSEINDYVNGLGVKLYQVKEVPLDITYDYVLAYHFPILSWLLTNGLKYDKLMCGSLSGFVELETPHCICKYNTALQVHSESLKQQIIAEYCINENQIYVMPNIVPLEFINCECKPNTSVQKIAIVSNHCPAELRKIVKLFALQNVKVDIFGRNDNYVPINAELLSGYDVVVTIGKTVQYALVMGIPVYNYDHFGGAGYITLENMDNEEDYNYSGRSSFRKLSTDDIVCEIGAYYNRVLAQMPEIKRIARERYSIKIAIDKLIEYLDNQPHINCEQSLENEKLYYKACEFCIEEVTKLWERKTVPFLYYWKYFLYSKILRNKNKAKKYKDKLFI